MIDRIMKHIGDKALKTDVGRLDLTRRPESVTEIFDVPYIDDGDPGHKLDIYLCQDSGCKPVLIDIHGGGFISEDKAMNRLFGNYMASLGFVVFELNVRLAYPEVTVFDQILDIGEAVRFVCGVAGEYGGDAEQMYICGHSSGGVLAVAEALMCVDEEMRSAYGSADRGYSYKGVITDCGLMHYYKTSIAYWGMRRMIFPHGYKTDPRYRYLIFDENKALERLPRVAVMTNRKDVLRKMTYHFDEVLSKFGCEHQLFEYGPDGHTGIIFVPYKEANMKVLNDVRQYLTGGVT